MKVPFKILHSKKIVDRNDGSHKSNLYYAVDPSDDVVAIRITSEFISQYVKDDVITLPYSDFKRIKKMDFSTTAQVTVNTPL